MDIGFVGLRNDIVARRLARAGVRIFSCDPEGRAEVLANESMVVALPNATAVARVLPAPRVIWVDLPTGFATELAIQDIWPEFAPGDVIVDAGDGNTADAARRTAALASVRIAFVTCRVHVDPDGASLALALGGDVAAIRVVAPYADLVAGISRWTHGGPAGAGYHGDLPADRKGTR